MKKTYNGLKYPFKRFSEETFLVIISQKSYRNFSSGTKNTNQRPAVHKQK